MKYKSLLIFSILFFNSFLYAGFFSNDENIESYQKKVNQIHYKNSIELQLKEKINKLFNNYKNQSIVTDKNIIYYRNDPIYRRPPRIYKIWTRASVTSIDNGDFYYIIPEGYRIIYEKEGELYIDYQPDPTLYNKNKSKLEIINNY